MEYLKTFCRTVVKKILFLNQRKYLERLERLEQERWHRLMEVKGLGLEERIKRIEQERLDLEQRQLELHLLRLDLEQRQLEQWKLAKLYRSLVEIKQKSHIKGWLSKILLEEWRGELEALRCGWLEKGKSELWIKIMTGFHLLGLLNAYLQIKVENTWLPKKKQS
ncbi:MAG: hypothetical protein RM347_008945 [Nostoc sp. ChiQUE02]|uniref:hypothetical protein n=1 Tax=Nostoc sp. ChiQUE02 TaxID=3075377 RepID=UPI002AD3E6EE|nr:hypothetical protein [Nostoc sp. ChiQUE02]MDZ8232925.1 hypothetical protein [Nostoc sp. ChiQUE02]